MSNLSSAQLEQISHIFRLCDPENTGAITIHGLRTVAPQLSDEELIQLFAKLDSDNDGKILFHEFVEGCASWFSSGEATEEGELYNNHELQDDRMNEELIGKQKEIERLVSKITKYKHKIMELNLRIELQQSQLIEAEGLNRELNSNLTTLQSELQKQKKDSKTILVLNRKISTLEEEIAVEIEKYSALKQNETKLNNLKAKLTEEKNKLIEESLTLQEEIMKLKNANIALDSKLNSANLLIRDKQQIGEKLKDISIENKELHQKLNDYYQLSISVKSLTDENKKLNSLYEESRSLLSHSQNTINELNTKIEQLSISQPNRAMNFIDSNHGNGFAISSFGIANEIDEDSLEFELQSSFNSHSTPQMFEFVPNSFSDEIGDSVNNSIIHPSEEVEEESIFDEINEIDQSSVDSISNSVIIDNDTFVDVDNKDENIEMNVEDHQKVKENFSQENSQNNDSKLNELIVQINKENEELKTKNIEIQQENEKNKEIINELTNEKKSMIDAVEAMKKAIQDEREKRLLVDKLVEEMKLEKEKEILALTEEQKNLAQKLSDKEEEVKRSFDLLETSKAKGFAVEEENQKKMKQIEEDFQKQIVFAEEAFKQQLANLQNDFNLKLRSLEDRQKLAIKQVEDEKDQINQKRSEDQSENELKVQRQLKLIDELNEQIAKLSQKNEKKKEKFNKFKSSSEDENKKLNLKINEQQNYILKLENELNALKNNLNEVRKKGQYYYENALRMHAQLMELKKSPPTPVNTPINTPPNPTTNPVNPQPTTNPLPVVKSTPISTPTQPKYPIKTNINPVNNSKPQTHVIPDNQKTSSAFAKLFAAERERLNKASGSKYGRISTFDTSAPSRGGYWPQLPQIVPSPQSNKK